MKILREKKFFEFENISSASVASGPTTWATHQEQEHIDAVRTSVSYANSKLATMERASVGGRRGAADAAESIDGAFVLDRVESQASGNAPCWDLDLMARAFSLGDLKSAKRQIQNSIKRVPYHGLWAGTTQLKKSGAIVFGQIGQDLVRSLNNALGQYATAEQLGQALQQAYKSACGILRQEGLYLQVMSQEYNMVFMRSSRTPTQVEAKRLQSVLAEQVWQKTQTFLEQAQHKYPGKVTAIESVRTSLREDVPLLNVGICSGLKTNGLSSVEYAARFAIGASAAAKIARTQAEGFSFADVDQVCAALRNYRDLLRSFSDVSLEGLPVVMSDQNGDFILNPSVLVLFRGKKLQGAANEIIGKAVSYLNCLDWVQQSRFSDISCHFENALKGRKLVRELNLKTAAKHDRSIKEFCLKHVPYLGLADELTRSDGTLFWVDMKKLAVRCHVIREAEALSLLHRVDAHEKLNMDDIVDSMIAIDTRVQDARDVLPAAAKLAQEYLSVQGLDATVRFHIGGDDAALLVHLNGKSLPAQLAADLGNYLACNSERLRIAHCSVKAGANLAEEMCKLDRILAATKID